MARVTLALLCVVLSLLSGCASSKLTKLDLTLTASEQVNPDLHGRPSPIVVRLIELRHPVAFENADFFSLYGRAEQTLPKDFVSSEELELSPGEQVMLKLSVEEGSRYVGVLAAYRDLPRAQWRFVLALPSQRLTRVGLVLDQAGIRLVNPDAAKAGE